MFGKNLLKLLSIQLKIHHMVSFEELQSFSKWYYGNITTKWAERILEDNETGAFLVRKSKSKKDRIVISVKTSENPLQIQHITAPTPFVDEDSNINRLHDFVNTLLTITQVELKSFVNFKPLLVLIPYIYTNLRFTKFFMRLLLTIKMVFIKKETHSF